MINARSISWITRLYYPRWSISSSTRRNGAPKSISQTSWLAIKETSRRGLVCLACNNRSRIRGIIHGRVSHRGCALPHGTGDIRDAAVRRHYDCITPCWHVQWRCKLSYNTIPLLRMSAAVAESSHRVSLAQLVINSRFVIPGKPKPPRRNVGYDVVWALYRCGLSETSRASIAASRKITWEST